MNKVYKLKLLRDTRQLVVVSELATNAATAATEAREFLSADSLFAQPQDLTKTKLSATAGSLLVAALGFAAPLVSATTDPQVVAGTAEITKQGLVTTIKNTPNTIINWNSFSIAKNEIVEFLQQSKNSAVLNRVLGTQASEILGSLSSNGKVFLINPNGILFGNSATVNVAELVASTLELKDEDFKASRYVFAQDKDLAIASIINQGLIKVQDDGTLALVGGKVVNNGVLEARNGSVYLLAGNSITISDLENPLISYKVAADNEAINLGAIVSKKVNLLGNKVAHGASSQVSYADIFTAANTTKRNDLNAVVTATGEVELFAGSVAEQVQTNKQAAIQVTGDRSGVAVVNAEISTYNPTGKAGNIKVLGDYVAIENNAKLNATGLEGGYINLGGDYQGQGTIKTAKVTYLEVGAEVNTSAQHQAGTIIVWGDKARFAGSLKAESVEANGGFIETSAHSFSLDDKIDISTLSQKGKDLTGTWLLDPDDLYIYNATNTSPEVEDSIKSKSLDSASNQPANAEGSPFTFTATTEASSLKDETITAKLESTDVSLVASGSILVTSGSRVSGANHTLSMKAGSEEVTEGSGNIVINQAEITTKKLTLEASGSIDVINSNLSAKSKEGHGAKQAPISLEAGKDITIRDGSVITVKSDSRVFGEAGYGEIYAGSKAGNITVKRGAVTDTDITQLDVSYINFTAHEDVNFNEVKFRSASDFFDSVCVTATIEQKSANGKVKFENLILDFTNLTVNAQGSVEVINSSRTLWDITAKDLIEKFYIKSVGDQTYSKSDLSAVSNGYWSSEGTIKLTDASKLFISYNQEYYPTTQDEELKRGIAPTTGLIVEKKSTIESGSTSDIDIRVPQGPITIDDSNISGTIVSLEARDGITVTNGSNIDSSGSMYFNATGEHGSILIEKESRVGSQGLVFDATLNKGNFTLDTEAKIIALGTDPLEITTKGSGNIKITGGSSFKTNAHALKLSTEDGNIELSGRAEILTRNNKLAVFSTKTGNIDLNNFSINSKYGFFLFNTSEAGNITISNGSQIAVTHGSIQLNSANEAKIKEQETKLEAGYILLNSTAGSIEVTDQAEIIVNENTLSFDVDEFMNVADYNYGDEEGFDIDDVYGTSSDESSLEAANAAREEARRKALIEAGLPEDADIDLFSFNDSPYNSRSYTLFDLDDSDSEVAEEEYDKEEITKILNANQEGLVVRANAGSIKFDSAKAKSAKVAVFESKDRVDFVKAELEATKNLNVSSEAIKIIDKSSLVITEGKLTVAATGDNGTIFSENSNYSTPSFGNFSATAGITFNQDIRLSGSKESTIFNINCKGRVPECIIGKTALGPATVYPDFVTEGEKIVKEVNVPKNDPNLPPVEVLTDPKAPLTPVALPPTGEEEQSDQPRFEFRNIDISKDDVPLVRPQLAPHVAVLHEGDNNSSLLVFGDLDEDLNATKDVTLTSRNVRAENVGSDLKVTLCRVNGKDNLGLLKVDGETKETANSESACSQSN